MTIQELKTAFFVFEELKKISKKIHRLDEIACNVGNSPRQDKTRNRLMSLAGELAGKLNLGAYHQGDPRGCSLYLVENINDDMNYINGIAVTY